MITDHAPFEHISDALAGIFDDDLEKTEKRARKRAAVEAVERPMPIDQDLTDEVDDDGRPIAYQYDNIQ